jgi:hypothetical protein
MNIIDNLRRDHPQAEGLSDAVVLEVHNQEEPLGCWLADGHMQ